MTLVKCLKSGKVFELPDTDESYEVGLKHMRECHGCMGIFYDYGNDKEGYNV